MDDHATHWFRCALAMDVLRCIQSTDGASRANAASSFWWQSAVAPVSSKCSRVYLLSRKYSLRAMHQNNRKRSCRNWVAPSCRCCVLTFALRGCAEDRRGSSRVSNGPVAPVASHATSLLVRSICATVDRTKAGLPTRSTPGAHSRLQQHSFVPSRSVLESNLRRICGICWIARVATKNVTVVFIANL